MSKIDDLMRKSWIAPDWEERISSPKYRNTVPLNRSGIPSKRYCPCKSSGNRSNVSERSISPPTQPSVNLWTLFNCEEAKDMLRISRKNALISCGVKARSSLVSTYALRFTLSPSISKGGSSLESMVRCMCCGAFSRSTWSSWKEGASGVRRSRPSRTIRIGEVMCSKMAFVHSL